MPQLAIFIATAAGAVFGELAKFLAKMFVAKAAVRVTGVAVLVALASGLITTFNGYIVPLLSMLFDTQYGQFIGLAFPPVAGTVMTIYMSAILAVGTYKLQVRATTLTSGM